MSSIESSDTNKWVGDAKDRMKKRIVIWKLTKIRVQTKKIIRTKEKTSKYDADTIKHNDTKEWAM